MPKLIKNGEWEKNDPWVILRGDAVTETDLSQGAYVIPFEHYEKLTADNALDQAAIGVWVSGESEAAQLQPHLETLPIVCIEFPTFMDGRGFSLARALREHYDYTGELRAIGSFLQDQMFYLTRCGFNAFEIPDEFNLDSVKSSLQAFTVKYQAAIDEPQPLFRRRN